jgi:hypothetical protein
VRVPRPIAVVFVLAAVGLLAADLALVGQNAKLRALNSRYAAGQHVDPGQPLPALAGIGFDGRQVTVGYREGGEGALILVFEPRC